MAYDSYGGRLFHFILETYVFSDEDPHVLFFWLISDVSWQEEASQQKGTSASEEGGSSHDRKKAQLEQNAEHWEQVDAHYNRNRDAFAKRGEQAGPSSSSKIANEEAAELEKDRCARGESTCMKIQIYKHPRM